MRLRRARETMRQKIGNESINKALRRQTTLDRLSTTLQRRQTGGSYSPRYETLVCACNVVDNRSNVVCLRSALFLDSLPIFWRIVSRARRSRILHCRALAKTAHSARSSAALRYSRTPSRGSELTSRKSVLK